MTTKIFRFLDHISERNKNQIINNLLCDDTKQRSENATNTRRLIDEFNRIVYPIESKDEAFM